MPPHGSSPRIPPPRCSPRRTRTCWIVRCTGGACPRSAPSAPPVTGPTTRSSACSWTSRPRPWTCTSSRRCWTCGCCLAPRRRRSPSASCPRSPGASCCAPSAPSPASADRPGARRSHGSRRATTSVLSRPRGSSIGSSPTHCPRTRCGLARSPSGWTGSRSGCAPSGAGTGISWRVSPRCRCCSGCSACSPPRRPSPGARCSRSSTAAAAPVPRRARCARCRIGRSRPLPPRCAAAPCCGGGRAPTTPRARSAGTRPRSPRSQRAGGACSPPRSMRPCRSMPRCGVCGGPRRSSSCCPGGGSRRCRGRAACSRISARVTGCGPRS